jgi:hypothetical protein
MIEPQKTRNIDRLHCMSQTLTEDCVHWDGSFYPNGYGVLRKAKQMVSAHREAFLNANGYLPTVVMHTCDNRACVNVKHLQAGTTQTNTDDKIAKKRHVYGEAVKISVLTETQVIEIRRIGTTMFQKDIAKLMKCSQTLISQVLLRKIWTHI